MENINIQHLDSAIPICTFIFLVIQNHVRVCHPLASAWGLYHSVKMWNIYSLPFFVVFVSHSDR